MDDQAVPAQGDNCKQSFVIEFEGAIYFTHGAWKFSLDPANADPMHRESVDQLRRFLNGAPFRAASIEEIAFKGVSTGPGIGPHVVVRRHPQDSDDPA